MKAACPVSTGKERDTNSLTYILGAIVTSGMPPQSMALPAGAQSHAQSVQFFYIF
jgi:hypothetical protein